MGSGSDRNAGIGMGGVGLRYRPVPSFALEANIDVAGGRDYDGYRRSESTFSTNALVFLNPRNITQVYLLGGIGWSSARVANRTPFDNHYRHFGGQAGLGVEFRLSKLVALNFDVRGFVRSRIDSDPTPEFIDANGRTTNTSGGGIMQGGLTFYW
jgi:hypothetical protein